MEEGMTEPGLLVFPSGRRWGVRRVGAARASALFDTEKEAIRRAERLAKAEGARLSIFSRDGLIRRQTVYSMGQDEPEA